MTNERELEALLRECYEWLFESKTDGPRVSEGAIAKGYYTEAFAEFHNRLQAALTREQQAGVDDEAARKAVGDVFKNLPKTGSPKHHGRFG